MRNQIKIEIDVPQLPAKGEIWSLEIDGNIIAGSFGEIGEVIITDENENELLDETLIYSLIDYALSV